jgi:hypothetical protein
MDDRLSPKPQNKIIEDALRSYPVASMPRDITLNVMARIQTTPAPRFRFTRNDYLLALVLTIVFSAIFFGIQSLPPHILLQMRIQRILLWQSILVNARWLVPASLFGLAALLSALTIPSLYQMTMDPRR